MGADAVYLYYGVKRKIPLNDRDQIQQLEERTHPFYKLAYKHKLKMTWGRLTDGADYFVLIGQQIGQYGAEGTHEDSISDAQMMEIIENTKQRLKAADIVDFPTFIVQLEAQY